eukprot:TRINITY_DN4982_c0_g1_i2.p1 TRINITY_DN4982_c0_g1~~TRINITY_DN4982_c0_g1_i2.p1  ORF type:complete len:121 (-),score=2.95 TRINITY_DN4982_c0_g1_i2:30-392(-)
MVKISYLRAKPNCGRKLTVMKSKQLQFLLFVGVWRGRVFTKKSFAHRVPATMNLSLYPKSTSLWCRAHGIGDATSVQLQKNGPSLTKRAPDGMVVPINVRLCLIASFSTSSFGLPASSRQ